MVAVSPVRAHPSEVFDLKPTSAQSRHGGRIRGMATIPELLDGDVTLVSSRVRLLFRAHDLHPQIRMCGIIPALLKYK